MYNPSNPYNMGYVNPYQTQPTNNNFQQRVEVVKVNGQNGANAYQLAPNSSILLLDESQPIVWLKTTDGAGYPTVTPYSITPYKPEPTIDVKSLNDRLDRLERIVNESYTTNNDGKSYEPSNETTATNNQRGTKSTRNAK